MEREAEGLFAISKAGHDKGSIYVVVREEENYFFVADGKNKLLENPKKKNKKHIQIINKKAAQINRIFIGCVAGFIFDTNQIT